jgi:hypothetical protein
MNDNTFFRVLLVSVVVTMVAWAIISSIGACIAIRMLLP